MDLGDLFHDVAYNIQLVVNTMNPLVDILNQAWIDPILPKCVK